MSCWESLEKQRHRGGSTLNVAWGGKPVPLTHTNEPLQVSPNEAQGQPLRCWNPQGCCCRLYCPSCREACMFPQQTLSASHPELREGGGSAPSWEQSTELALLLQEPGYAQSPQSPPLSQPLLLDSACSYDLGLQYRTSILQMFIQHLLDAGDIAINKAKVSDWKEFTLQRGMLPISKQARSFQNVGNVRKKINRGSIMIIAECVEEWWWWERLSFRKSGHGRFPENWD